MMRHFLLPVTLLIFSSPYLHAQNPFETLKTLHFEVKYEKGVPELDARQVADYLEDDYTYLNKQTGLELQQPLVVRLYASLGSYISQSKMKKTWRGGFYERGVFHLQPVESLLKRKIMEQTLSFEFATAMLDEVGRKGCPRWLREAFAVSYCGEMAGLTPAYGMLVSYFSDLDQIIEQYPDPPKRDDVHFVLGHTMKFIVDRYGEDRANGVFKAFDGVTGVEEVFSKQFKESYVTIEKAWAAYISTQTQKLKK